MKVKVNLKSLPGIALSIIRAEQMKKKRGWDTLYYAVDLHDTVVWSTYTKEEATPSHFFPGAIEALNYISQRRKDIVLILYTSSYTEYIQPYLDSFKTRGIYFKYHNENPECPSTDIGDFSKKFYFNVLFDDKAGFNPTKDWEDVLNLLLILEQAEPEYVIDGYAVSDIQTYLGIKQ